MSQESNDKRYRFEQKMRDQGADGFADGPRPWETWDESGNQANNRIWEGSAMRVNGMYPKNSLGQRLLSTLALIALTTLLVGIGGVYYTHTQTQIQQLAQTGTQPLPVTDQARPEITSPDSEVVVAAAKESNNLKVLSAPAKDAESMQNQVAATAETATADSEVTPITDEPANEPATAITATTSTGTIPPATNGSIDSVAIETIITEQSVTTTVYTRHPRQDEPEIVAAIETTPPPFAHELAAEKQQSTDSQPLTVAATDTGTLDEQVMALSTLPPPAAQASIPAFAETDTVDDPDAISPPEDQYTLDSQLAVPAGDARIIALADMSNETGNSEPVAETAAVASEDPGEDPGKDQGDGVAVEQPAELAGDATIIAWADMSNETSITEPVAETAAVVGEDPGEDPAKDQGDAVAVEEPAEPAGDATIIAWADMSSETGITEPVAETAAVVSEDPAENQGDAVAVEEPTEPAGDAAIIALADMSSETGTTEPVAKTAADNPEEQLIETMEPVIPVAKTGNWVINLSSYTWKATANRKLALFQQQGVDAEVFEVMIKDKPMYRIRVTGFENSRAAKAEIPKLEQKLDLEGAWISKR